MIGLDTNILVRAFAADDPAQTEAVVRLLDEASADAFFLNVVVLVEFAWTMRRAFKWDDDWIRVAMNHVVSHPALVVQHRECVLEAIALSDPKSNGFADRLIAALNREAGCEITLTFDRDAARQPDFRVLTT